ncbi:outer membrane protein [Methylocella silvestris]|uniref:outer membrane protein n=1 Tax=Methylocella silvestris TaxID=199596 RepID=UPI0015E07F57|nr:outer membrane beta-barrel protein [Methylocella silvestris]
MISLSAKFHNARALLAAGCACLAAPAFAADLAPPPPVFTWSGLYIGFNFGYAVPASTSFNTSAVDLGDSSAVIPHLWGAAAAAGATGAVGARLNGFMSGGQLGYNWQFGDRWIAGVETDIAAGGVRGGGGFTTVTPAAVPPFNVATSVSVNRTLEYLGTVRGRLGYAVTPTIMAYVTGGLAYGGLSTATTVRQSFNPSVFPSAAAQSDFFSNRFGWTIGGGGEMALTDAMSAKFEALYYNLGSANTSGVPLIHSALIGDGVVGTGISTSTRFQGVMIRGGLNYRFVGSAPTASGAAPTLPAPQFVALTPPAFADWHVTVMPYLWALSLNGTTTAHGEQIGANVSFPDLLTKSSSPPLEAAAHIEARNGPLSIFADYVWAQVRASGSILAQRTPVTGLTLAADGTGHLKFNARAILEGGGAYEVLRWDGPSGSSTAIDAIAGARYWNMRTNVSLDIVGAANIPALGLTQIGRQALADSGELAWVDPLVGLRLRQELASGDEFQLKGDIGGFGVGSKISWQTVGGYVHNFQFYGFNCQSMIGYRALEVDYAKGSGVGQSGINIVLHGPIAGIGLRF